MTKEEYIAKEIDENPSLADMTDAILDACDEDNQGFFATIESGDIDWAGRRRNRWIQCWDIDWTSRRRKRWIQCWG